MTDKVAVPEGMLKATENAISDDRSYFDRESILEAALSWLSENPIVPTEEQVSEIHHAMDAAGDTNNRFEVSFTREWQSRMFIAPEPKVSELVTGFSDLLWDSKGDLVDMRHNDEIREAWNRAKTMYSTPDRDAPELEGCPVYKALLDSGVTISNDWLCPECGDRLVPDNSYCYRKVFLRCPNVQCSEYETRYDWPTINLKVAEE